jgi:hypothetical protein
MYPTLIHRSSARTPRVGRLTTLLLVAIATAGVAGCSESSDPTAAALEATTPDLRFEPSGLAVAPGDTARTTVRVATGAARIFFVDPTSGSDANSGSETKPFKTLGKALSKARSGDTVKLAAGGYGPAATSGEAFPASGLAVPAGVTIEGALDGGFPVSTLVGPGVGVGLNFAGDVTVRNLAVGGAGFGVGMFARQGTQTLSNIFLGVTAQSAVVDGVTLNGGIVLRGTAQATLLAGASQANTTGSTIFLSGNAGTGVTLFEQARFTMNGGQITGGGVNCRIATRGFFLRDLAEATLTNVVAFQLAGVALDMENGSKATLTRTTIAKILPNGCTPPPSVSLSHSTSLTLRGGSRMNGGTNESTTLGGVGIQMLSDGALTILEGSGIGGYSTGIKVSGKGSLTMDKADFSNHLGVDATFAQGSVTITNSRFVTNAPFELSPGTGTIGIIASRLKLRNSEVSSNATGILITGTGVDLGTISDPGNNTFVNNGTTSVAFGSNGAGNSIVSAVGNTWNPNTQGADASGHYTQHVLVTRESPIAFGKNFKLSTLSGASADNFQIQL